jgi:hypothetical protein
VGSYRDCINKAVELGIVRVGEGDRPGREWIRVQKPLSSAMLSLLGDSTVSSSSTTTSRRDSSRGSTRSSYTPSAAERRSFYPLIRFLSSLPPSPPPLRGLVSQNLPNRMLAFQIAQCSSWSEYASKAERLGFVELGIDGELSGGVD